jgi:hypothetical protein
MAFQLTILDANAEPIQAGLRLQLLRDGTIVGDGTVEEKGIVTFATSADGIGRLAVRIHDQELTAPSD